MLLCREILQEAEGGHDDAEVDAQLGGQLESAEVLFYTVLLKHACRLPNTLSQRKIKLSNCWQSVLTEV